MLDLNTAFCDVISVSSFLLDKMSVDGDRCVHYSAYRGVETARGGGQVEWQEKRILCIIISYCRHPCEVCVVTGQ